MGPPLDELEDDVFPWSPLEEPPLDEELVVPWSPQEEPPLDEELVLP